jgi:hypothetical protein
MFEWAALAVGIASILMLIRGFRKGSLPAARGLTPPVKRSDHPTFFGVWFGIFITIATEVTVYFALIIARRLGII